MKRKNVFVEWQKCRRRHRRHQTKLVTGKLCCAVCMANAKDFSKLILELNANVEQYAPKLHARQTQRLSTTATQQQQKKRIGHTLQQKKKLSCDRN